MLPRRFVPHPSGSSEPLVSAQGLLKQTTLVVIAVLTLALVVAFAAEALSFVAPATALVPTP